MNKVIVDQTFRLKKALKIHLTIKYIKIIIHVKSLSTKETEYFDSRHHLKVCFVYFLSVLLGIVGSLSVFLVLFGVDLYRSRGGIDWCHKSSMGEVQCNTTCQVLFGLHQLRRRSSWMSANSVMCFGKLYISSLLSHLYI